MTCWSLVIFSIVFSVRDNACVNYDVTTVEITTSRDISTGNISCDISCVQISNISNNDITGDNECTIPMCSLCRTDMDEGTIPYVSTVTGTGECIYHSQCIVCGGIS